MMLPKADMAVVERDKIVEYLLNAHHPDNGGKAAFFTGLGFTPEHWETFAAALRKLAITTLVSQHMESMHGNKYIIDGEIENPSGKAARARTVWIIDAGTDFPRLVTAYPFGR